MDINIKINIDNAAFGDNWENADGEIKRIINRIDFERLIREDYERPLMDINGNKVGQVNTEL
jgi:hypothetical protein